ncbi:MAG: aspartyl/glutamyl-tRNA amidotransferase subunit C [Elusimicrobia bacterium]|nr:aspartyl/glutamyl-tRNA amidotransferase subunit C [Elusimicrobiota bacterium]
MDTEKLFDQVAHLARLGPYSAEARAKMAGEFGRTLDLFKVLSEVPAAPAAVRDQGPTNSCFRDDAAVPPKAAARIVKNFPQKEGSLLKVPKVIE